MPTYVYACRQCEDRTEVVQKMSDAALIECGHCGGPLRRVLFPPAVVYKGSGFYTTDYKNSGRKSESGENAAAGPAKSEARSDSKSDGKSDGKSDSNGNSKVESKVDRKSEAKSEAKSA